MDMSKLSPKEDIKARINKLAEKISSSELLPAQKEKIISLLGKIEDIMATYNEGFNTPVQPMSQTETTTHVAEPGGNADASPVDAGVAPTELDVFIEKVKHGDYQCTYINSSLAEEAKNKDRNRCKGRMTSEVLWRNEYDQHISTEKLWETASALWNDFPEIFEPFDQDREIDSNSDRWSVEYLDKQRNYLRYNFSLERLCHLILIYDKLYGNRATIPAKHHTDNTVRKGKPSRTSFSNPSLFGAGSDDKTTARPVNCRQNRPAAGMRVAASHTIIAIVIAFVAGIIVGKGCSASSKHTQNNPQPTNGPQPVQGEEERMPIGDKRPQTNEEAIGEARPDGSDVPKEGLETTENLHEPSETTKHSGSK
ncbi:MAG: hypothetical protein GX927_02660 [Lentisphaerae bacterium]|nr:hypothetical protein [Lentisphaerota bacterium]